MKRRLSAGALVDVRASDRTGIALYRVLRPHILPTPYHRGSDKWAWMRRYDPQRKRFLRARPVQVARVVRVHDNQRETPLDFQNGIQR